MTLRYMQGFESMRDDTDFRAQNWVPGPTKQLAGFIPSITSVGGTSLHMIGSGSASATASGASGAVDLGCLNTGVTVNQAWLAGGFTFGFNARYNSGIVASYGAGQMSNCNQACFDGSLYWAIRVVAGVYSIATSPDLKNWTVIPSQPPTTLQANATIASMGGGVIAVVINTSSSTSQVVYYTNNQGASWSSQTLGTVASAAASIGVACATGNTSFPHAVMIGTQIAGSATVVYVGTLGGTMTQVVTATSSVGAINGARPRIIGGLLVFMTYNNQIVTATAANSSLNTSGAWTTTAAWTGSVVYTTDVAYNPVSNLWVVTAGTGGIYTAPNSGAAGTPVALTGTPVFTNRYSAAGMQNVFWTGSQLVATGINGHIVTSPDGLTWTESGGHLIPVGTSGTDWRCTLYDGSRYVLFSDQTNGVIATTPDGVTNYQAQYIQDGTENRNVTNACGSVGVYSGTAPAPTTGLWTSNANIATIVVGAPTASTRPLALYYGTGASSYAATATVSTTNPVHYFEIVATATATANTFMLSVYIDDLLVMSDPTARLQGASTTDTTSLLILVPSRSGSFVAYDDMYFTLQDGVAPSGRLSPVSIVAETPNTDVSVQWVKNGTAVSNSLSAGVAALSLNPGNYVSSTNAGDKDVYGTTTGVIPSGYTVRAVQVEGYIAQNGSGTVVANVGIISGSTESDGTSVSVSSTTPTYTSQIYAKDPNGSIAWTAAAVNAAQTVLNHIS
jgi:hypothetical protein